MLKNEHGKEWRDQLPQTEPIDWSILSRNLITTNNGSTPTNQSAAGNTPSTLPAEKSGEKTMESSKGNAKPGDSEKTPTKTMESPSSNKTLPSISQQKSQQKVTVEKTAEEQFKETKEKGNKCVQEVNTRNAEC